jgi:predicted RNase H-like HicB family nuclease
MKISVVVHEAEEGGFWAEVPAIPGCATQGETSEELLENLYEAVEGSLSIEILQPKRRPRGAKARIVQIVV